jgi:hypothetical protein
MNEAYEGDVVCHAYNRSLAGVVILASDGDGYTTVYWETKLSTDTHHVNYLEYLVDDGSYWL